MTGDFELRVNGKQHINHNISFTTVLNLTHTLSLNEANNMSIKNNMKKTTQQQTPHDENHERVPYQLSLIYYVLLRKHRHNDCAA